MDTSILGVGRMETMVKLNPPFPKAAYAVVVNGRRSANRYRYVKLVKGKVYIGQVGDFGDEKAGIKGSGSVPALALGAWFTLRVDLLPDATTVVYVNGEEVASYQFPDVTTGAAGLLTKAARIYFDDVKIWDEKIFGTAR